MRKLVALPLFLVPAVAFAQAGPPPPAPDDPQVEQASPQGSAPDVQPPAPPVTPPAPPQDSGSDQVGILQQGDGVGILQGGGDEVASAPAPQVQAQAPSAAGQWVYTNQYGWVWMPYGQQYVDEATWGASTPYQFVFSIGVGWRWVAAPWLWGWGHYRGGYVRGGTVYRAPAYRAPSYRSGWTRRGTTWHTTRPVVVNRGGFRGSRSGGRR